MRFAASVASSSEPIHACKLMANRSLYAASGGDHEDSLPGLDPDLNVCFVPGAVPGRDLDPWELRQIL